MGVGDRWARLGRRLDSTIGHFLPSGYRPLPRRPQTSERSAASYALLSAWPPVFCVAHWMDEHNRPVESLDALFDYLRDQPAYFLYFWFWHIEDPARVEVVRRLEKRHHRRYPKHRFIHCCNTPRQMEVFLEQGLDALLCNHNCLVDERVFKPLAALPRAYDAVYDARLKAYKRHELAARVRNLALLYDFNPGIDDARYADNIRQDFAHAHFFNHRDGRHDGATYRKLSATEVNECLNRCKVGLCLSAVEGAMFASIQYLLAGLPVVSTRSKGGRDVFFDAGYVLIVDDDADAVAAGVKQLIARRVPADTIRRGTIAKARVHREALISRVQRIYDEEGVRRDFAAEWDTVFADKLITRWQSHADTLQRLDAAARGRHPRQ